MRPMRRGRQELSPEACRGILERGRECVLALAGSDATDGFPYAVPVNYSFASPTEAEGEAGVVGHLLLHGAPKGAKLDAIAADARVSACVIERGDVVPEQLTTYFQSVIAFGRARLVDGDDARRAALLALCAKYAPDLGAETVDAAIARFFARTAIVDVTVERASGKQSIELV